MTQEKNKKAVADLFCMEDARAVCEAIGGLGLNTDNQATDDPLEYTPDNILDVTVNENPDGMPALPQFTPKEMDNETQAFVVDELAKELQADGRESLNDEDLVPFMVKIKGENSISQDLTPFIDQITGNTNNRLATQNVSEAQPNGVATDLRNGGNGAAPAAPAVADPAAGTGALPPEAPGGLAAPTEAPALDANAGDSLNGDELWGNDAAAPGAEGEFNLDVPEPGAEDASAGGDDTFNLDIGDEGGEAPAGDDTDTIGELDFGDEGGEGTPEGGDASTEGGSSEDDLFSALDGMSDEELDDGSDLGGEGDTDNAGDAGDAGDLGGEGEGGSEDEKPAETECASAPAETECASAPVKTECGEAPVDNTDIQLESIKANYVANLAKERVRAITEAYDRKRALAEKRALCESIISNYQENEAAKERKAVVESTMGEKLSELGDKVATLCENASKDKGLDAKLESILNNAKKDKSVPSSSDVLDAKLESILGKVKASKALDAKLESIVNKVAADKAVDAKLAAIVESVKTPKAVPAKAPAKAPLDAKLESIIASTKQKIAAAK